VTPSAVAVVGGGPAGLGVAAGLRRRGREAVVLERDRVMSTWRRGYDRLELNSSAALSHLPGRRFPPEAGRWVSRDAYVAHGEALRDARRLDVREGVEVRRIDHATDGGWLLATSSGPVGARAVVVATGLNAVPRIPPWPGAEGFAGTLLHASAYRSAEGWSGRDVLVAGGGNSGLDIAADLAAGGASPVRLAIRTPPHIVGRELLGVPNDVWGVALRPLPARAVDLIGAAVRRATQPDLDRLGLRRPPAGLGTSVARGRITTVDQGDGLARIRAGQVEVVGAVEALDGAHVVLRCGRRLAPALVVAATGYASGLPGLVGHLGVLGPGGRPRVAAARPALPGLWLLGFVHPISGNLRELRLDAGRIAAAIAADAAA